MTWSKMPHGLSCKTHVMCYVKYMSWHVIRSITTRSIKYITQQITWYYIVHYMNYIRIALRFTCILHRILLIPLQRTLNELLHTITCRLSWYYMYDYKCFTHYITWHYIIYYTIYYQFFTYLLHVYYICFYMKCYKTNYIVYYMLLPHHHLFFNMWITQAFTLEVTCRLLDLFLALHVMLHEITHWLL
jgi:hypothetical protein